MRSPEAVEADWSAYIVVAVLDSTRLPTSRRRRMVMAVACLPLTPVRSPRLARCQRRFGADCTSTVGAPESMRHGPIEMGGALTVISGDARCSFCVFDPIG